MLIELIKNLGLDENEAKIYLALLELGPNLVTKIGQKAGINRTTSYDILERLVKYGLVTYASGKESKKRYSAEPPTRLINFLERKQKKEKKQLDELKKKLPELQFLFKDAKKPVIKFFEGIEGVKAIYAETLKSKTEILSAGDCEEWDSPELSAWVKNYNRQRAKLKINERILILPEKKTLNWFKNYPTTLKYTKYKILPKDRFPIFDSEINIYEDRVMIALLKKPNRMGVMITSEHLANILKTIFEMAWEAADKYSPTYPINRLG
ncbi:MAG: helix-turn-helix domain-containing protein [Candidatus Kuenenbacteria bacterium]